MSHNDANRHYSPTARAGLAPAQLVDSRLRWLILLLILALLLPVPGAAQTETPTGPAEAAMKGGVPYFRKAGVEHDVINANETEYAFIEIELK